MKADPILAIVAVARLCEIGWNELDSHNWFALDYKTWKLSCVDGSTPMICKPLMVPKRRMTKTERFVSFTLKTSPREACLLIFTMRLGYSNWIRKWTTS